MRDGFEIGDIKIGIKEPALVIPEMGINHEGSLEVAKLIVDAAKRAGARIIKHQTHIVDDEMSNVARNVVPGNSNDSIYDIMARCALNEEDEYELKRYVEAQNMVYLSTPFSRAAADRLERFGVLAYKIGSGELNNYPLIRHIAAFKKPMIISTGMNNMSSIKKAVSIVEEYKVPYALMHTTNLYPTQPKWVRLGAMKEMMDEFPNIPIGLSDHTINNNACIGAMALGASVVERHFIDIKDRPGPDVICSMDEKELRDLLNASDEINLMLGGRKEALTEERVTINFAYSSVVSIDNIKAGDVFTMDNIWVKRPGTGELPAAQFENILGKKASCDIENDTQLKWAMIDE